MRRLRPWAAIGGVTVVLAACNSGAPEPASVDLGPARPRLTIVRTATDPFLPRYNLTLRVEGGEGCSSSTELFPDTGYTGRRNVYVTPKGLVYVIGQFDARVIDPRDCGTTLSEFRHLDREVVFLGSFDEDGARRWTYFAASERPERTFASR